MYRHDIKSFTHMEMACTFIMINIKWSKINGSFRYLIYQCRY